MTLLPCMWLVAGKRLVTGSHDKFMMLADIHGHVQRTWKASHVHDLAISKDGCLLFCVTSEKKVDVLLALHSGPWSQQIRFKSSC